MAILRDTNLWISKIHDNPYFYDYEDILSKSPNRYNWVIRQEAMGVLMTGGASELEAERILSELMEEHLYIKPNQQVLGTVKEVYGKCRPALNGKQDVKDVYIAAYAIFYDDTVVTHDYEFQRLQFYEPRLKIYTRRPAMPQGEHPMNVLPRNIRELDRYMDKLQAKEKTLPR